MNHFRTAGDSTRCVNAGLPAPEPGSPLRPGATMASQYHLDPVLGHQDGLDGYGRTDNPTWRALEAAIGDLEGGQCRVFASGMAAITAVLLSFARRDSTVMVPADGYYGTRVLAGEHLAELGLTVLPVPTAGPYPSFDGVSLVLLESPANPTLDVCDIGRLAAAAHRAGALVAVDNTTATPLGQRPLDHGADLSVASATKAMTGHSDLVMGYVCGRADLIARIEQVRNLTGAVPGPFEAWLAHRSIGTLDLRLSRQSANAAAVCEVLERHPAVVEVRWPGLPTDPGYPLAIRQLHRFPGVLNFTLADKSAVDRFFAATQMITVATSFGGMHTSADRRAQWGDPVPEGFVRLSCGIEDTVDLVADLEAGLDAAGEE